MKITTKNIKKELLLISPPSCTPNDKKRNMVGTNANMGMMVAKLTKMDKQKGILEVKKSPNMMQVK